MLLVDERHSPESALSDAARHPRGTAVGGLEEERLTCVGRIRDGAGEPAVRRRDEPERLHIVAPRQSRPRPQAAAVGRAHDEALPLVGAAEDPRAQPVGGEDVGQRDGSRGGRFLPAHSPVEGA